MRRLYSSKIQEATEELQDYLQNKIPEPIRVKYSDLLSVIDNYSKDDLYSLGQYLDQVLDDLDSYLYQSEAFEDVFRQAANIKLEFEKKKKLIQDTISGKSKLNSPSDSVREGLIEKLNKLPVNSEKDVFNLANQMLKTLKLQPWFRGKFEQLYLKVIKSLIGKAWMNQAEVLEKWRNIFNSLKQIDSKSQSLDRIIQRLNQIDPRLLKRSQLTQRRRLGGKLNA